MQDVVSVRHLGGMRLWIRFDDGVGGEVDLAKRIKRYPGFMARLLEPEYFAKVFVHPEFRTVSWPGGWIDLDTLVLYSYVTGKSIRALQREGHPFKPPRPRRKPHRARAAASSAR